MIVAQLLRTVFFGVLLFLSVGTLCGIVAALLRLKFGSGLPRAEERRLQIMDPAPGLDPINGEAGPVPRRPRRPPNAAPIQPQYFKKARRRV